MASVLRNKSLVSFMLRFQHGLPHATQSFHALATDVGVHPMLCDDPELPAAFLTNLPASSLATEYMQRYLAASPECQDAIPSSWLFLDDQLSALPLHLAILGGHVAHVRHYLAFAPHWVTPGALTLAAACGHLSLLQLLATHLPIPSAAMDLAATNGFLDIVRDCHAAGVVETQQAIDGASANGHVDVVTFLHQQCGAVCSRDALLAAIAHVHVDVVLYLVTSARLDISTTIEPWNELWDGAAYRSAAPGDPLSMLQLLCDHGVEDISENLVTAAIERHGRTALQFILDKTMLDMATPSLLHTVIRLRDKDCIALVLRAVAGANDQSLTHPSLLWTMEDAPPSTPWQPTGDWSPMPWRDSAMDVAARVGDLSTLQLLQNLGLDLCTTRAMDNACAHGHLEIAQWLQAHRTEGGTANALTQAAANGHVSVVRWLLDHRPLVAGMDEEACRISDACVVAAARNGHLQVLLLLHAVPSTTAAMDAAAREGHLDVVQYLQLHRTEGCSDDAFFDALNGQHDAVFAFVVKTYGHVVEDRDRLYVRMANLGRIDLLELVLAHVPHATSKVLQEMMLLHAAAAGNVALLQWLHETKQFAWTSHVLDTARDRKQRKVVAYLTTSAGPEAISALSDDQAQFALHVDL
ncbi:hypothetical protein SDRG_04636 [Saprolegnia diclina VS20]|uniref:Ankyrin repeat domain-containing protein n=1 Tax=Saprolegnia diclina (strain VS20) TaxID=1156394 RepID=T0QJJ6_SAPDV|nr:hypothetical protein SDRG_04636 [Saprolegnia diclina VS20]EQC38209.1 hypothetical protein SDRG_04636 [Saprolegnia diclina VS20]|eukprot:XP_008608536.1 hypothetical protein SDRG_04636 [Saprolegnia diclina VS20]